MNLYEQSKSSLFSLIKQTGQVGLGLIAILLLTKGNPSPLVLGGTVITGIGYVAYTEQKRLTKNHDNSK